MAEEERTRDSHLGFSLTPKTPVTCTHIPVTGMNCNGGWGMWGKSRIIQRASDTSTACPQITTECINMCSQFKGPKAFK